MDNVCLLKMCWYCKSGSGCIGGHGERVAPAYNGVWERVPPAGSRDRGHGARVQSPKSPDAESFLTVERPREAANLTYSLYSAKSVTTCLPLTSVPCFSHAQVCLSCDQHRRLSIGALSNAPKKAVGVLHPEEFGYKIPI